MLGRNDKVEFNVDGEWTKGPSLPNVLSSHTSHVVNNDIFVFGGLIADSGRHGSKVWHLVQMFLVGKSHLPDIGRFQLLSNQKRLGQVDTVYRLAENEQNWKAIGRLDRPRSHHASVPVPGGRVFIFGDPYVASRAEIWSNSTVNSRELSGQFQHTFSRVLKLILENTKSLLSYSKS